MSSHLYQIAEQYRLFQDGLDFMMEAIAAGDMPEEAFCDTLDSLDGEFEAKADSICCIIKDEAAFIEDMKDEVARLQARIKARENAVTRMKSYLTAQFSAVGKTKMQTTRNSVSFRPSKSVQLADPRAFVEWARTHDRDDLLTYKDPEPSKTQIKAALTAGQEIPGASIVESKNIQIK